MHEFFHICYCFAQSSADDDIATRRTFRGGESYSDPDRGRGAPHLDPSAVSEALPPKAALPLVRALG